MHQLQLRGPKLIAPPPFWPSVAPLACVGEDPADIVVEYDYGRPPVAPAVHNPGKPLPGMRPTTVPPPVNPVRPPPIIRQNDGNDRARRGLRHEPILGPGGGSHSNRW